MKNLLSKTAVFILLYLLFMIPTYILPYMGSNSTIMDGMARAGGYQGPNYGFWIHLISLLVLVILAWIRTSRLTKNYLYIFPILALAFDLVPVLSMIPLIPTIMHLLTLILGVTLAKQTNHETISTQ